MGLTLAVRRSQPAHTSTVKQSDDLRQSLTERLVTSGAVADDDHVVQGHIIDDDDESLALESLLESIAFDLSAENISPQRADELRAAALNSFVQSGPESVESAESVENEKQQAAAHAAFDT
jgi:hypothetical protein